MKKDPTQGPKDEILKKWVERRRIWETSTKEPRTFLIKGKFHLKTRRNNPIIFHQRYQGEDQKLVPNLVWLNRIVDLYNDILSSYFQHVLKKKKQITLDKFIKKHWRRTCLWTGSVKTSSLQMLAKFRALNNILRHFWVLNCIFLGSVRTKLLPNWFEGVLENLYESDCHKNTKLYSWTSAWCF